MARRHEGFTIAVIPHSAHGRRRELRVSGAGAPFFRTAVALVAIAIAASIYISVSGAIGQTRQTVLKRRIESLEDSLAMASDINARLESIEEQLEEIRATRRVIENLATQGAPQAEQ